MYATSLFAIVAAALAGFAQAAPHNLHPAAPVVPVVVDSDDDHVGGLLGSHLVDLDTDHIGTKGVSTGHVLSHLVETDDINVDDVVKDVDVKNILKKRGNGLFGGEGLLGTDDSLLGGDGLLGTDEGLLGEDGLGLVNDKRKKKRDLGDDYWTDILEKRNLLNEFLDKRQQQQEEEENEEANNTEEQQEEELKKRNNVGGGGILGTHLVDAETGHVGTDDIETGDVLSQLVTTGDIDVEDVVKDVSVEGVLKRSLLGNNAVDVDTDHIGTEDVGIDDVASHLVEIGDVDADDIVKDISVENILGGYD